MSAISLKSITGITSITTPAGVDDQLTLHNNNTTERVKIDVAGNFHINNQLAVAGVSTLGSGASGQVRLDYQGNQRLKTHTWGVEVSNTLSATNIVATAANSSFAGASFTSAIDANGDLDVDGHTNLDNVNIAGVTTTSGNLFVDGNIEIPSSGRYLKIWTGGTQGIRLNHGGTYGELDNLTGMMRIKAGSVNLANRFGNYNFINCAANGSVDLYYDAQNHTTPKLATSATGVTIDGTAVAGGLDISGDIDVDGHTNLDNVSIAGVTTSVGNITIQNTYPSIFLVDSDNNDDFSIQNQNGLFAVRDETNSANRLSIASNGNVSVTNDLDVDGHTNLDNVSIAGVTTSLGLVNININASQSASNPLLLQNSAAAGNGSNPDVVKLAFGSQGTVKASIRADVYGNGAMTFHTNNDTEKLRITAGGQVGIGTDNPIGKLHIWSTGPDIILTDSNQATDNRNWLLTGANTQVLRIQAQNDSYSGGGNLFDFYRSGNQLNEFRGMNGGNYWFVVNNSTKKVGINTTNPQDELHIEDADPAIRLSDSVNGQYAFIDGNSGHLTLHSDKGNSGSSSYIKFAVDNSVKMTLDRHGHLDLATGNLQFANGAGLDFSNVPASGNTLTSDGNKLDDYEEGTYTPTATTGAGGNITGTTSFTLRYVKVGRLVHIVGRLHFATSANNLSSLTLSLPFTNTAGNQHDTSVCTHVIRGNGGDPVQGIRIFRIGPGSTTMFMNNHEGQSYGDLGTTTPHININFSYFAA